MIPHRQVGLQASLPQAASPLVVVGPPETISVGLASDGSRWISQSAVKLDDLRGFFLSVSWLSALIVLFSSKVTVLSSLERLPTLRSSGASPLRARDLLNKGVAAFKNAQFDAAVEDFKQAKELDPDLINARLYLATAYASQYIPGAPSDENMRHGQEAVAEYRDVLE